MDYEAFYGEYQQISETLKAQAAGQQKLLKRIDKCLASGDIKAAVKDLSAAADTVKSCAETVSRMAACVGAVDMADYLASGEFAAQLAEACRTANVNIAGEGTNFEVFPYRLKLEPQNTDLLINGRKAPGLRPKALAEALAKGRDKLLAASFNPTQFLEEMAYAYDLAGLAGPAAAKNKPAAQEADIYLNTLYKYLTPMRRFRRDYDQQSYAFDLARLYSHQTEQTPDGRNFQFGPSRNNVRAIRIVDADGAERFLATIRFYRK